MERWIAIIAITATMLGAASPMPAHASAAVDAALGLGAFAVFTQLFGWGLYRPYYEPVVVVPSASYPAVYAVPPVYTLPQLAYAPPTPAIQREVTYPHGRYVLYGDGVTSAYQWVWIWNPPPVPAPPPAGAPPPAPPGAR